MYSIWWKWDSAMVLHHEGSFCSVFLGNVFRVSVPSEWCESPTKWVSLQRRYINHLDNESFPIFKTTCQKLLQLLSCSWWAYSNPILLVQVGSDVKRRVLSPWALLQLQGLQAARALGVAVAPPPGSPWHVLPVKPAEPVALELHVERRARPRTLPAPRPAVAKRLDLRQYGGSCCAEPCVSGGRHKRWGELMRIASVVVVSILWKVPCVTFCFLTVQLRNDWTYYW